MGMKNCTFNKCIRMLNALWTTIHFPKTISYNFSVAFSLWKMELWNGKYDFLCLVSLSMRNSCMTDKKIWGEIKLSSPLGFIFPSRGKLRPTLNALFYDHFVRIIYTNILLDFWLFHETPSGGVCVIFKT